MNEHTLRVLEFDKVKSIVASYAFSEAGKDLVVGLSPALDHQAAAILLDETREFTRILESGEIAPLDGIPDTRQMILKLHATGGVLSARELLNAAYLLAAGRRVKKFFQRFEGRGTEARPGTPLLAAKAAMIRPLKEIEDRLFGAIDENAEIKDSASPELRKVRKQMARMREEILGRMSGILQDAGFQKVIQEPVITLRDDRYVLPLKPGFRQSLQGVVHGHSGSRATLFVEPLQILEQNNRLAELRMEEREEVERILRELTALLCGEAQSVETTMNALAEIDCVQARARFGVACRGTVPAISPDAGLGLKAARHPLLVVKYSTQEKRRSVTPNDIVLEGGQRAFILSGPNAGGKTVVLKTAGLLSVMAQSGIPITAAEGSELSCFSSIFADIGDEQSLEQDLSTFSSHVGQIAEILRRADKGSLVLLDELGAGTEPGEGAGLGAAVLESLIRRGCVTLVTTHHNALKLFGSETAGATNAAMEFDPQTLKPTYRLIPGRPGRSYGLDVASRLGIPAEVIERARARLGQDNIRLEKLLEQVEEEERLLAAERGLAREELIAARTDRKKAEEALRAACEEARDLKSKVRTEARETVAALKRKLQELSRADSLERAEARKVSSEVEALENRLDEPRAEQRSSPAFAEHLHSGDTVRIARLNKTGTVLTLHRDMLELEVGGKKVKLSASEVVPEKSAPEARPATATPGWGAELGEEESAGDRLNIIGLRIPEGLAEVDRFIDRAGLYHLNSVTIIHGLGTGALKNAVTDFLRNHPLVASFRTGNQAEGGAGVTVAELKK